MMEIQFYLFPVALEDHQEKTAYIFCHPLLNQSETRKPGIQT